MTLENRFAFNIKVFKLSANVHLGQKMGWISRIFMYVSLVLTILHEITLIMDTVLNGMGDFQRFCEDAPMAMAFLMVTYEFYNIVAQKENIENLLKILESTKIDHQPNFARKTYKKSAIGKIGDNMDKLGFYNILFGCLCVQLWILRPIVTKSGKLPFGNPWFPFDYHKYYHYLLALNGYVGTLGAINTINVHIFYGKIMAVISEQFDVLSHSLKSIDNMEEIKEFDSVKIEKEIFERVKKCVKYHQEILKCCEQLQKCINGILVCQYCFGISLCFAALATFSMNAFSAAFINLMNHILLELSELYIYCWFSSKLTEYAEKVTERVFHSKWYDRAPKTKRLLRFVVMRCKKPVLIKVANLIPASIGSYIWILQQSYSYFMVLRQVRAKITK